MSGKNKNGGPPPTRKVKVVQPLHVSKNDNVKATGDKRIQDAIVVVVSLPGIVTRQLTVHHPIGHTALGSDDWVCTPSSDVQDLLNHISNPLEAGVMKKRRDKSRGAAIEQGLLKQVDLDGVVTYTYPNSGDVRNDAIKAAKRAIADQTKTDGEVPTAKFNSLLSIANQADEAALMTYYNSPELLKWLKDEVPLPAFETRSGPLNDRPQVKLAMPPGSGVQAVDYIVKAFAQNVGIETAPSAVEEKSVQSTLGKIASAVGRGRSRTARTRSPTTQ